jgi:hypothetical protein
MILERGWKMATKQFPSLAEAARLYGVSYWRLYMPYRKGKLAAKRVGHSLEVSAKDVERLLVNRPAARWQP